MMAHFTARSTFVWDDIVNFREAQVSGLSLDYLLDAWPAVAVAAQERLGRPSASERTGPPGGAGPIREP